MTKLLDAVGANGSGTAIDVVGDIARIRFDGTFAADVTIEGSLDGTTFPIVIADIRGGRTILAAGAVATPVRREFDISGFVKIRATVANYVSGAVTVTVEEMRSLNIISVRVRPATAGGEGTKELAAEATPEVLAASTPCTSVTITAQIGNTKQIAVGFSNAVRATAGGEVGMQLQPGDSVTLNVVNLNLIWLDAQVNGEGVSYTYLKN